jgi:hypothetical protein
MLDRKNNQSKNYIKLNKNAIKQINYTYIRQPASMRKKKCVIAYLA